MKFPKLPSLLVSSVKWTEVFGKKPSHSFSSSILLPISAVSSCVERLKGTTRNSSFLKTISTNMTSNSNLSNMRRLVEQLKLEASVERIKVSQAAAELQQYCLQNAGKDALLVGVPTGSNPFREPRSCAVV
uniref:Guanine nucleotide-binding protein subunit gamma n=12 Tax=Percomorphaceae TaxID=1489872 RepID=A0A8C9ZAL6_SANLU